jgi:hypothetical protein
LKLEAGVKQYYFSLTSGAIPYSGVGAAIEYDFLAGQKNQIGLNVGFDRISNNNSPLVLCRAQLNFTVLL